MGTDTGWFIALAASAAAAWGIGAVVGRRRPKYAAAAILIAVALLAGWTFLSRNPSVAVQIIPVYVLSHIEGVAAVPVFLFIMGLLFAKAQVPRQKRVAAWATLLGGVYFMQGGLWLIQAAPQVGFADAIHRGPVRQSVEYSCVPAACATSLNLLGYYTSEAEMVRLTSTRPGVGSTTVRALYGLNQRLEALRAPGRFTLIGATIDEVRRLPTPALTPLQFDRTQRHMVTILEADEHFIWLEDPIEGTLCFDYIEFEKYFRGDVLVYTER